jgi:hypothetical protein
MGLLPNRDGVRHSAVDAGINLLRHAVPTSQRGNWTDRLTPRGRSLAAAIAALAPLAAGLAAQKWPDLVGPLFAIVMLGILAASCYVFWELLKWSLTVKVICCMIIGVIALVKLLPLLSINVTMPNSESAPPRPILQPSPPDSIYSYNYLSLRCHGYNGEKPDYAFVVKLFPKMPPEFVNESVNEARFKPRSAETCALSNDAQTPVYNLTLIFDFSVQYPNRWIHLKSDFAHNPPMVLTIDRVPAGKANLVLRIRNVMADDVVIAPITVCHADLPNHPDAPCSLPQFTLFAGSQTLRFGPLAAVPMYLKHP